MKAKLKGWKAKRARQLCAFAEQGIELSPEQIAKVLGAPVEMVKSAMAAVEKRRG
jgi:DNA-directed RNA polymerase specialized sigma24 family protein